MTIVELQRELEKLVETGMPPTTEVTLFIDHGVPYAGTLTEVSPAYAFDPRLDTLNLCAIKR